MQKPLFVLGSTAVLAGLYARYIERRWLDVNHVTYKSQDIPPAFDGYKIAQLSDIHYDDWVSKGFLDQTIDEISRADADLTVITGDFVSNRVKYNAETYTKSLQRISTPDGVLAIPGNHDYWANINRVRQLMQDTDIIDLSNDVHTLTRPDNTGKKQHLHIAGVDDVVFQKSRLDLVLKKLDTLPDGPVILLAHEPDFADISSATGRFMLQLSGHSHAGQVRIPFYGPLYGPKHGIIYKSGRKNVEGMALYVNRGLGTVMLPIRFLCRPELTIFTLKHDSRKKSIWSRLKGE